ncbi:MAG TPA: hypothetical protein VIH95_01295 [Acidimicrobiales bacterium]
MTVIAVAGALANKWGNGGEAWIRTSWVRGLARLGVDAWLVEEIDAATCTDDDGRPCEPADSTQVAWFGAMARRFALEDRAVLRLRTGRDGQAGHVGPTGRIPGDVLWGDRAAPALMADTADVVLNVGGHLDVRLLAPRAHAVFVDIDPGWSQSWLASDPAGRSGHDAFYSVAVHLGRPGCSLDTAGLDWRPIRQPVVLEDWPMVPLPDDARFTTVATWRHPFGSPAGVTGPNVLKHHEFRKIVDLPTRSPESHELALRIDAADDGDRRRLEAHGWLVRDAGDVAGTPDTFRDYVQGSRAELSAAQGIYVHSRSGWFSDRSVRYLASGRPVVVQDTGLAECYPVGEGLLPFDDVDDILAAEASLARDYGAHAQAARDIAERFFDADVVLSRLLDEVAA